MNSLTDTINAVYRSYDSVCVSTEQFYHYLLPVRTLFACLAIDLLALLTLWLSYGIELDAIPEQPIYLVAVTTSPWIVGYVLPITQDLEFLWHYSCQLLEFAAADTQALVHDAMMSLYYRTANTLAALRGSL